jgi:D-aspartate ligase
MDEFWTDLLLSHNHECLRGSLIITCCDAAIEFVALNQHKLSENYLLDDAKSEMQIALLDKKKTLELASRAGVGAPQFWQADSEVDLVDIRKSVQFPVMVKPLASHKFVEVFGRKLFIIESSFDELVEKVRHSWANNLDVMVVEMIPGPDSLLSSYYTYIDANNNTCFDYTKRIIRRYPVNRGLACYHASQWLPETAEAGRKFFEGIGFTGLGNVEFKRDLRDNQLKIIESNARFTAAQELVIQSGAPIDLIYYCNATGQPAPSFGNYSNGLTYWYGLRDFLAFVEMNRNGQLGFFQWIKSLFPLNHVAPLHSLSDPLPTFGAFIARIEKTLRAVL